MPREAVDLKRLRPKDERCLVALLRSLARDGETHTCVQGRPEVCGEPAEMLSLDDGDYFYICRACVRFRRTKLGDTGRFVPNKDERDNFRARRLLKRLGLKAKASHA